MERANYQEHHNKLCSHKPERAFILLYQGATAITQEKFMSKKLSQTVSSSVYSVV